MIEYLNKHTFITEKKKMYWLQLLLSYSEVSNDDSGVLPTSYLDTALGNHRRATADLERARDAQNSVGVSLVLTEHLFTRASLTCTSELQTSINSRVSVGHGEEEFLRQKVSEEFVF